MTSARSIAAAIEAIPAKKESLRRAFDNVLAHPSAIFPLSLDWEDLDHHLSSLQRSVEAGFLQLQSFEKETSLPPAVSGDKALTDAGSLPEAAAASGAPEFESKDEERSAATAVAAAASAANKATPKPQEKDVCAAAEEEEPEEETEEEPEEEEEEPEEEEEEPGEEEEEEPEEEEEEPQDREEPEELEAEQKPDLRSFCDRMDGKGLRAFIAEKHEELSNIEGELDQAIGAAADPAALVLDAIDGFYPAKPKGTLGDAAAVLKNRKACILLLEHLHAISPEIGPLVRERAKKVAAEWKAKIPPQGGQKRALPFLQLLLSYGIMSEFELNDVLELLVSVAEWKHAVDLCRNLGLSDKMPDFIQKLFIKKKKIEAVKFVYAFKLVDKFPPNQLLKSYLRDCKKVVVQARKKGKYSRMSQIMATNREIAAHRAVIKAIAEYKLESEYSPVVLQRRCKDLEDYKQRMLDQRKSEAEVNAALSDSITLTDKEANKRLRQSTTRFSTELKHFKSQMVDQRKSNTEASAALANSITLRQREANKRPRPSTVAESTAPAAHPCPPLPQAHPIVAAHPRPLLPQTQPIIAAHSFASFPEATPVVAAHPLAPFPQIQPQVQVTNRGSYLTSSGPYGPSTSYLYDTTPVSYMANPLGLGPMRSPPRPSLHSDPPVGSGLYDKSGDYCSYSLSGGYQGP